MQHDEFIGHVQDRARLPSRGDAERITRATLETLAERMGEGTAGNLAAQLPHEIGEHLRRTAGEPNPFGLDDFLARVLEREGTATEEPQALFHARVVTEVVDEATTGDLQGKVREQLPDDYAPLFAGSRG